MTLPSWEETLLRLSQAVKKDAAKRKARVQQPQQPADEQRKKLLQIFLNALIDEGTKE